MTRTIRLTRAGRLLPWMGPALRGLVAGGFKANVCLHAKPEHETTWKFCKGCPYMDDCPYGRLIEPDAPPDVPVMRGQEDVVRPLVLSPAFPIPGEPGEHHLIPVQRGMEIPIHATFIGLKAAGYAGYLWEAIRDAGRRRDGGFDPDGTKFELLPKPHGNFPVADWSQVELPLYADDVEESATFVKVQLQTPLFLRTRDEKGRRRDVKEPAFADLLRASLRTLGSLYAMYAQPLDADFAGLKIAARDVPMVESSYEPFRQPKTSGRSGNRLMYGVIGEATYANVPGALLHWLMWGGRLHVGSERIAGAGGWRIAWTQAKTPPDDPMAWEWVD